MAFVYFFCCISFYNERSIFLMNAVLIVNGRSHIIVNVSLSAPIAQGIERWSPEPGAQVRILVGAPHWSKTAAARAAAVCFVFSHPILTFPDL